MTTSHANTPASRFSKAVDTLSTADESITTHIHSADANPDVFTVDNISLDSIYNLFAKGGETECD